MINEGDKAPAMTVTSTDGGGVDLAFARPAFGALFLPEGRYIQAAPAETHGFAALAGDFPRRRREGHRRLEMKR